MLNAVHVSLMGVIQVGLLVPRPSLWDMVRPHLQLCTSPLPGGFSSAGSQLLSSAWAGVTA